MRRALLTFVSLVALAVPAAAGAAGQVTIRGVGLDEFPRVQLTAVVPQGARPALAEDGRPAGYVEARDLGSAQAIVLAVDNSSSMSGRPLREAKRAAGEFLAGRNAGTVGLVAFGHEALALTRAHSAGVRRRAGTRVVGSGHRDGDRSLRRRRLVGRAPEADGGWDADPRPPDGWARSRLEEHARAGDRRREARQRHRLLDRGRFQVGSQTAGRPRVGHRRPPVRCRGFGSPRRDVPRPCPGARPNVADLLSLTRTRR